MNNPVQARPSGTAELVAEYAAAAYEAIRAVNHLTITKPPLPAPDVYVPLADLARLGHALSQALDQLGDCLAGSLSTHQLYQDDGSDPAAAITRAESLLQSAAQLAQSFGVYTAAAQQAINEQGHHGLRTEMEAGR